MYSIQDKTAKKNSLKKINNNEMVYNAYNENITTNLHASLTHALKRIVITELDIDRRFHWNIPEYPTQCSVINTYIACKSYEAFLSITILLPRTERFHSMELSTKEERKPEFR